MTVSAADARTVPQLLDFVLDGGQPDFLMFWGHRPPPSGGVGKGCLSQWWPVTFTVDGVTYQSAEHFMMAAKALLFDDAETAAALASMGARVLLTALQETGLLSRYVPFDVSDEFLRGAAAMLAEEFDSLDIHVVIGDFHHHLAEIPS